MFSPLHIPNIKYTILGVIDISMNHISTNYLKPILISDTQIQKDINNL